MLGPIMIMSYQRISLILLLSCQLIFAQPKGPSVYAGKKYVSIDESFVNSLGTPPSIHSFDKDKSIIQVFIAAYREQRCGRTLYHLFKRALNPSNIRVVVVDQIEPTDKRCIDQFCDMWSEKEGDASCPYKHFVQSKYVKASQAKGPCYARGLGDKLLLEESYFCMQTDSHMLFIQHWDIEVMMEWQKAENEYGVLTTYVNDIKQLDQEKWSSVITWQVPHLCKTIRGGHGCVRNSQAEAANGITRPKLTVTWGAGFSFSRCHFVEKAPNDEKLHHIFDGEEYSRATRGWTRGYDFYTPSQNIVFHDYSPVKARWGGSNYKGDMRAETDAALKRLAMLWDQPKIHAYTQEEGDEFRNNNLYGMGKCRTRVQLEEFSGVKTRLSDGVISYSGPEKCADIAWVPYDVEGCHGGGKRQQLTTTSTSTSDTSTTIAGDVGDHVAEKTDVSIADVNEQTPGPSVVFNKFHEVTNPSPSPVFWFIFWVYLLGAFWVAQVELNLRF